MTTDHNERPWECPGAVRRDALPHRGPLLRLLGVTSLVLGFFVWCVVFLSPLGLILGLAAWLLAGRDLEQMGEGMMDPEGRSHTEQAQEAGKFGILLNASALLLWGVVFFYNFGK